MSRSTRRSARLAAGGAVALALLAGCSTELPQPEPEPTAETAPPVLDADRFDRVLEETAAAFAAADEARDPEALRPRVTAPALDMRAAEYRLAEAVGDDAAPSPVTTATQVEAVAATYEFPRTGMVITQVPEGANLPLLLGFTQSEAREQFKLWGWVELFPGSTTPPLIHPDTGSAQLGADSEGLVATPAQVVERYVDTLNNDDSEFADQFAEDPYKESSKKATTDLDSRIEAAGEASIAFEVGDDGLLALATADGGAIVLGELRSVQTIRKTVPGASLTIGGEIGALLGDDTEVRGTVSGTSDVLVAFYVPPEGGEDTVVRPLGAKTVMVEVARNDDEAPAEG
ncbi:hypothetical protein FE374_13295 [Georgenia yuyongxinii]|uniref:DUF8094 domain-containing protein n=1 Tax=Georgenia yuyongxinii TaxID=2589797 RepID=A0A5B8C7X6_9MICO|nr:hypothetical protein [Georgenia yuyongxinii]QDC25455.1 hypothetical protein FE374_13295 [Georgenia yuyongxinii]